MRYFVKSQPEKLTITNKHESLAACKEQVSNCLRLRFVLKTQFGGQTRVPRSLSAQQANVNSHLRERKIHVVGRYLIWALGPLGRKGESVIGFGGVRRL